MNTIPQVFVAGLVCLLDVVAQASKPPLQVCPIGAKVEPKRILRVKLAEGRIEPVGDWVEYTPFRERAWTDACLFDGFGREYGPTATGVPDDFGASCGSLLPPGARWYFGETYCNPFTEGDMRFHARGEVTEVDVAWFWYVRGASTSEDCYVGVFATDGDVSQCVPATSGTGFVIHFGVLHGDGGPGYFYSNVDVTGLGMTLSTETSTRVVLAKAFDGAVLTLCTCGQLMLWGSPNNSDTGYAAFPTAIGEQQDGELDDDNPTDGVLDPTAECYSSNFGVCPNPLQFMLGWGGIPECAENTPCPADFDGNGFVTGDDFDAFVGVFVHGNPPADFNCDGFVTGDDFDAYVAAFEAGC